MLYGSPMLLLPYTANPSNVP